MWRCVSILLCCFSRLGVEVCFQPRQLHGCTDDNKPLCSVDTQLEMSRRLFRKYSVLSTEPRLKTCRCSDRYVATNTTQNFMKSRQKCPAWRHKQGWKCLEVFTESIQFGRHKDDLKCPNMTPVLHSKHWWKCPEVSLDIIGFVGTNTTGEPRSLIKTFCFDATNMAENVLMSLRKYLIYLVKRGLTTSWCIIRNI